MLPKKIKKRVRAGQGPEGKQYWKTFEVVGGQPPGIEELPPPGCEGKPLSKSPAHRKGGTWVGHVSEALDKAADKEREN